jgi:hypothetical protein
MITAEGCQRRRENASPSRSKNASGMNTGIPLGLPVQGGPNPGHVAEEKPATAAVNGLGSKSPNRYIIQVLSTFLVFRNTGARSRYPAAASGLDLDRPLHFRYFAQLVDVPSKRGGAPDDGRQSRPITARIAGASESRHPARLRASARPDNPPI